MRTGAFISASLHVFVITLAYFGLPALFDSEPTPVQTIYVELVSLADQPVEKKSLSKPKPKPKAKLRPPPPPPAPPPPPPEAEPVPIAKPKPVLKPEVKVKSKPKPKPKKIVPKKVKLVKATPKPRRKPTPPKRTAQLKSLLRDIQNQPAPKKDVVRKKPKKPKKDELQKMLAGFASPPAVKTADMSPIDRRREVRALAQMVFRQVKPCWNPTTGAKGAHTMRVGIRIFLHPDGTLSGSPKVEDQARMLRDAVFRAFAESALRALRDPRCSPLRLPVKQYAAWRDISFNFDPREMLR